MRQVTLALLFGAGLAFPLSPAAGGEGKGQDVKLLAKGEWPHLPVYAAATMRREQQAWAIRGVKELQEVAGPHAPGTVARIAVSSASALAA